MEFGESSSIGGKDERMEFPLGVRFDPHPWELVSYVKLKNFDIPEVAQKLKTASLAWMKSSGSQSAQILFDIPVVRLYDFSHPNQIREKDFPYAIDGERYYFTKQVPQDALGKRSKRKVGEEGAYWKSTSIDIEITDLNGKPIGYMRKYTLYEDMDDKRSTNWYMEEYRVHNRHKLADPYILCKIYDKESRCPKYTETSIPALTKRFIERQLGSHQDQTNSQFDNMNQSQTQFDDSHFPKYLKQSTFSPPDHLSNEFSMSRDPSGNLNPPESIQPILGPPDNSNGFSMSHELSGNLNPPESTLLTTGRPCYNNEFPMCGGISNDFSMSHDLSGNLNPPESTLLIPEHTCYSNELPMFGGISNGFSMSHDLSGNLNPPESTLLIPGRPCYSNEFPMCGGISNDFSMSHDLTGNLNPPESTLLIPESPCYSNELPMFGGISNGFSMSHDQSGNLSPPESTLLIPGRPCYSNEFPMCGGISNDFSLSHDLSGNPKSPESTLLIPERPWYNNELPMFGGISNGFSMFHDLSGNQNAPDVEESPLDRCSQLWNHGKTYKIRWSGD